MPRRDATRERDHVHRRAVEVRAVDRLVDGGPTARPVVDQPLRLGCCWNIVPGRPEIARSETETAAAAPPPAARIPFEQSPVAKICAIQDPMLRRSSGRHGDRRARRSPRVAVAQEQTEFVRAGSRWHRHGPGLGRKTTTDIHPLDVAVVRGACRGQRQPVGGAAVSISQHHCDSGATRHGCGVNRQARQRNDREHLRGRDTPARRRRDDRHVRRARCREDRCPVSMRAAVWHSCMLSAGARPSNERPTPAKPLPVAVRVKAPPTRKLAGEIDVSVGARGFTVTGGWWLRACSHHSGRGGTRRCRAPLAS